MKTKPDFNFGEYFKDLCDNLQKKVSNVWLPDNEKLIVKSEPVRCLGLEWTPKKENKMKKTKWDSIDIKHEVYNKLESYRAEWSANNLSDVINNFILYYEANNEPEDDRYYCDNCGDYHD